MPRSQIDKDDIMDAVWMELERMFTVLSNQHSAEKSLFLREVETTIRSSLKQFTKSLVPAKTTDHQVPNLSQGKAVL